MYKGKYFKAITFSFDDGVIFDKRLIELLNKYNIKATFNLNSGLMYKDSNWIENGTQIYHLEKDEIGNIYDNHEIASHSYTHPELFKLDYDAQKKEIETDVKNLEAMFNRKIIGFAYPFGPYNDDTLKVLKELDIKWARSVYDTFNFDIPENLLTYNGTCHFRNPKVFEIAKEFLELKPTKNQVLYLWGHSYELEAYNYWEKFEEFLKLISNKDDIYYCTNSEAFGF